MKIEEQQLVTLAKLGNHNAFEELFRQNKEKIFNLTYQYTRNMQDAEDLLQETFSRAFLSVNQFKALDNATFSTWLYRIGVNCSLNFVKKQTQHQNRHMTGINPEDIMPTDTLPCQRANPEETATFNEMVNQLETGLESLSPRQRMIFVLKHHEGLKAKEIAQHMKCSAGSIKKQLNRAMANLTQRLSGQPGGEEA